MIIRSWESILSDDFSNKASRPSNDGIYIGMIRPSNELPNANEHAMRRNDLLKDFGRV